MIKNCIGINGVISEIVYLSKSNNHICADESSVIDSLCDRYNVTKSEAQIAIGLIRELGIIERHKDGRLEVLHQPKVKRSINKSRYNERRDVSHEYASVRRNHDLSVNNIKLRNALKEIIYEVMRMPDSSNARRIIKIISKVLGEVNENLTDKDENVQPSPSRVVNTNEERTYRRGKADGRFGHPPAEATESYLRGYPDGLQQKH